MKAIADTGFIVALRNRNDRHHAWAVWIAARLTEPLLTCEAVMAEAAFRLDSAGYVLSLVEEGMLCRAFEVSRNLAQVASLAARYEDRAAEQSPRPRKSPSP